MLHPLFSQTRILLYYLSGWLIIALMQGLVVYQMAPLSLAQIIGDTLIYNSILLILSFSFWFPLRYADKTSHTLTQMGNNLSVYVIYLAIWMAAGWGITRLLYGHEPDYVAFTTQIVWFRALWGAILLLLIAVLYHTFDYYRDLEEKKQQHEQMERLIKESELKALKSQLNPHFLFNSLNSISSLTITDPDGAREMIHKLSDFMRYSLRHNDHSLLPLRDELESMHRYLDIEKVRFGSRLESEIHAEATLLDLQVPAMILQPIYENAVKHGVYESIEPVHIRTYCRLHQGMLEISVINNYDPEALPRKGEGVGLENIRQRMRLLFQSDGLFQVSRENNHFEATLRIPQTTLA